MYMFLLRLFFSAALLSFPIVLLQSESRANTASMMESDGKGKSQDGKEEKGPAKSLSVRRSLSNEFRQAATVIPQTEGRRDSPPVQAAQSPSTIVWISCLVLPVRRSLGSAASESSTAAGSSQCRVS